jgi:hypothetical protein
LSNKRTRPIEPTTPLGCHLQPNSLRPLTAKRATKPKADFILALTQVIEPTGGLADDAGRRSGFVGLLRSWRQTSPHWDYAAELLLETGGDQQADRHRNSHDPDTARPTTRNADGGQSRQSTFGTFLPFRFDADQKKLGLPPRSLAAHACICIMPNRREPLHPPLIPIARSRSRVGGGAARNRRCGAGARSPNSTGPICILLGRPRCWGC